METPIGTIAGIDYQEEMVAVDSAVQLRVMVFKPQKHQGKGALLFVAGWISDISGWASLVREMARTRDVYYVETREKPSALISEKAPLSDDDISIARSALDIIAVCDYYGINSAQTLAFGSSLGAMTLLEAIKGGRLQVKTAFLVGPSSALIAPWFLLWVLYLPISFFYPLRSFIVWYLRTFRVDAQKEPEQMQRYEKTIGMAEPRRLKHSARSTILGKYRIWNDIETITVPVVIAYAVSDKLHSHKDIEQIAQRLPKGSLNPCPTNIYMHSDSLLVDIETFEKSLNQEKAQL